MDILIAIALVLIMAWGTHLFLNYMRVTPNSKTKD